MSEETQPAPEVTLQDIANAVKVIDVSSTRGAFKGEELSSVGTLRDKFSAYLQHHAPAPESVDTEENSGEESGDPAAEAGSEPGE